MLPNGRWREEINQSVNKMENECNVCGGNITIPSDIIEGEIVSCSDCGLEFEISEVGGNSVVLKTAEEIKEDWGE